MDRRRLLVHATALLPLPLAGCLDSIGSLGDDRSPGRTQTTTEGPSTTESTTTSDETPGQTTTPMQTVSLVDLPTFPDGPKEKPTPPSVWDDSSAKSFATEYEERRLYNEHHADDVTEITIACMASNVATIERGYEVSLWCQGAVYEENSKTHADYVGPDIVYRLTPTAVTRDVADS